MSEQTTTETNEPVATPSVPVPPQADWTASLEPDVRAALTSKGLNDPKVLAQSYIGLEKLMGAGPDALLRYPTKPMDTPEGKEAWNKIYDKLGRPQKPEEYGIAVPPGSDPTFANEFAKTFHELGLSKRQVEAITAKWNGTAETVQKVEAQKVEAAKTAMVAELKTKWGNAYEQNVGLAKKITQAFPDLVNDKTFAELESVMGPAKTVEFFHAIMSKTQSSQKFETGDNQGFQGELSPEQAKYEMSKLSKDVEFFRRLSNRDVDAIAKWDKLVKASIAFSQ